jgi:hypothetical protein
LQTLCWGCSRTSVLPISTSQVARITGLKHWCWPRWVIFFFFWQYQSLNSGPQCLLGRHYHLSHSALPFCVWYFQDRVSWTICPGWSQTLILLVSAFWVARTTGMGHQCPVRWMIFWQTWTLFSGFFQSEGGC